MTEAAQVDELQESINSDLEQAAKDDNVEALEPETKADPAPAQEEPVETPAEPDGVQKRINKITADKYEEKRRADALQSKLDALETQTPNVNQTPATEPKLEDFDYDDAKFNSALLDYKLDQRMAAQQATQNTEQAQVRADELSRNFNVQVEEFTKTAPDYQEVIANVPQLPAETLDAVMQLDNGAQVAYYLGKHLDVADEIATSSPMVAAMKLGEIRANLANNKQKSKPSAAPAPVETLTSGGGVDKDIGEMTMEEIYGS